MSFSITAAERSILAIAKTLIDPFSRRDVQPQLTNEARECHTVRVSFSGFEREGKGPTRELALARLLGKLEKELQRRVDAGQDCLVREYATLSEAHRLVVEHDFARKAVG